MSKFLRPVWWILGLRALAAIILGIGVLFWLQQTVSVLVILFGVYALVVGILTIIAALRSPQQQQGWPLVKGAVGIFAGIISFVWSGITAVLLLYLIAIYSLLTGVIEIAEVSQLQGSQTGLRPYMILSGIAGLLFGFFALVQTGDGVLAKNWLIALYFLAFGCIGLMTTFHIWRAHGELAAVPA